MTVAPFSEIEPYLIQSESSGQNIMQQQVPQSVSTAGGYFQITNSTWGGVPTSITQGYGTAISAPFSVQEAAANYLWNTNQGSDWLGNGGSYPGNSAVIAANNALVNGETPSNITVSPSVSNLLANNNTYSPPTSGSPLTITAPSNFTSGSVGLPDQGTVSNNGLITSGDASTILGNTLTNNNTNPLWSYQPTINASGAFASGGAIGSLGGALGGLLGGIANSQQSWWQTLVTDIQDIAIRFGLLLLALVLLGAAAFALSKKEMLPTSISVSK